MGLSFPHFFNGSDSLREPFEGLNPDPEKHDSYAYINPVSNFQLHIFSKKVAGSTAKGSSFLLNVNF